MFKEFYESLLNIRINKQHGNVNVICPFHNDNSPSLSINIDNGLFYCFGCGIGGNHIKFAKMLGKEVEFKPKIKKQIKEAEDMPYDIDVIRSILKRCYSHLKQNKARLKYLIEEKLWSEAVIDLFRIGYYEDEDYYTIPLFDLEKRDLYGIYTHRSNRLPKYKIRKFKDFNIFPLDVIYKENSNFCILCEGISDTLTLLSHNINAHTFVIPTGAVLSDDVAKVLKQYQQVIVITDNDYAGISIRKRYCNVLSELNISYVNLELPEEYKDISDFIKAKSIEDFKNFLLNHKVYDYVEVKDVPKVKSYNKEVMMDGKVVAISDTSYFATDKVKIKCQPGIYKFCEHCSLYHLPSYKGEITFELDKVHKIQTIGISTSKLESYLKSVIGIPKDCAFPIDRELKVCKIFKVSPIEDSVNANYESSVSAIYFSEENIVRSNLDYLFKGNIIAHPKDQSIVFIIESAKPVDTLFYDESYIESFDYFRCSPKVENMEEKISSIVRDLISYTGIDRYNLILSYLLTFFSPLYLLIDEEKIKGYLDVLIFGDTQTGKTTIANKLVELFDIGTVVSGEIVSPVGLTVGLVNTVNGWTLSWGILPRYDKRIVIIDEADRILKGELNLLTSARSSGYVEVLKIIQARALSRVRLLFIANPDRPLAYYVKPYYALDGFNLTRQDMARFDFVYPVPAKMYESVYHKELPANKEIFRNYIRYTYMKESCLVSLEAFKLSNELANKIKIICKNFEYPFIENLQNKLLRIAGSYANIFDHNIILPSHVEMAYNFYLSILAELEVELDDTDYPILRLFDYEVLMRVKKLLYKDTYSLNDLKIIFGVDDKDIVDLINKLAKFDFIKIEKDNKYSFTKSFISQLKSITKWKRNSQKR